MRILRAASAGFTFIALAGVAGALLMPVIQGTPLLRSEQAQAAVTPVRAAIPAAETQQGAPRTELAAALASAPNYAQSIRIDRSGAPLQCAIYARNRTGISLSGDARNWWPQAQGRYRRSHTPEAGAVMVMDGTASGHVAVVARVISSREILIDHANWMGSGEIITGALAVDASPNNDWTQVRVWHPPTNALGLRPYPVYGFVHPGAV
ncbi:MAG: CHAP domain-containing protein [Hyphomonadaceae bacterium]